MAYGKRNTISTDISKVIFGLLGEPGVGKTAIVEALAPPEAKKKKRERSNGKPNGIVLDGADNFGWIHL